MSTTRQSIERGIYKQPGSDNLYISYSDATGKVVRATTGQTSLPEARRLRKKAIADVEAGKPIAPKQRKVTVGDLFAMILADYAAEGQVERPLKTSIQRLHNEFGDHEAALSLTADRIRGYAARRLKEGNAKSTVRGDLSVLKRAFAIAVELGRLGTAPVIKPPTVGKENARSGFLTRAEFERLRDALPSDLRDPVEFLFWSGWRVSEMRTLEWKDVQSDGTIWLDPQKSKNNEGRELPLNESLREIIERAKAKRPSLQSRFVFLRADGSPIGLFRKSWATACRKAGLGSIIVHDLRRTAIRNLVRSGVSETVAMSLSGHKTRAIFDRYNITSSDDRKNAMRALHDHLGSESTAAPTVVPLTKAS
jgi:integrase